MAIAAIGMIVHLTTDQHTAFEGGWDYGRLAADAPVRAIMR
jgi:hypothetical protein